MQAAGIFQKTGERNRISFLWTSFLFGVYVCVNNKTTRRDNQAAETDLTYIHYRRSKMNKTALKNEKTIAIEKLEKVAGGYDTGVGYPILPGFPGVTIPDERPDDKPRDGGATGSW